MTLGGPPSQMPTTKELLDRSINTEIDLNARIGSLDPQIQQLKLEITNLPQSSEKQYMLGEINNLQSQRSEYVRQLESVREEINILESTLAGEESLRKEGK